MSTGRKLAKPKEYEIERSEEPDEVIEAEEAFDEDDNDDDEEDDDDEDDDGEEEGEDEEDEEDDDDDGGDVDEEGEDDDDDDGDDDDDDDDDDEEDVNNAPKVSRSRSTVTDSAAISGEEEEEDEDDEIDEEEDDDDEEEEEEEIDDYNADEIDDVDDVAPLIDDDDDEELIEKELVDEKDDDEDYDEYEDQPTKQTKKSPDVSISKNQNQKLTIKVRFNEKEQFHNISSPAEEFSSPTTSSGPTSRTKSMRAPTNVKPVSLSLKPARPTRKAAAAPKPSQTSSGRRSRGSVKSYKEVDEDDDFENDDINEDSGTTTTAATGDDDDLGDDDSIMEDQASDAGFGFEDDDEDDEGEVLNNNDLTRMTERQRSRYLDTSEDIELPEDIKPKAKSAELLALSNEPLKKKQFTEEEIQLRKLENARKRKNFNIKRLEMEKRDTLNKLLLKRADKVKNLQALEGQEYLDEDENSASKPNQRQLLKHKALFSWYSKTVTSDDGTRKNVSLYHIP